jgi:hypothetical protein
MLWTLAPQVRRNSAPLLSAAPLNSKHEGMEAQAYCGHSILRSL